MSICIVTCFCIELCVNRLARYLRVLLPARIPSLISESAIDTIQLREILFVMIMMMCYAFFNIHTSIKQISQSLNQVIIIIMRFR